MNNATILQYFIFNISKNEAHVLVLLCNMNRNYVLLAFASNSATKT